MIEGTDRTPQAEHESEDDEQNDHGEEEIGSSQVTMEILPEESSILIARTRKMNCWRMLYS